MNQTEIREILSQIVRDELKLDPSLLEGDITKRLDSVQRLSLVVAIEDRFQFCFEPEEEAEIHTLDDLVDVITRRVVHVD